MQLLSGDNLSKREMFPDLLEDLEDDCVQLQPSPCSVLEEGVALRGIVWPVGTLQG